MTRAEQITAVLVEHSRCRMVDHDADGAQFDCGLIVVGPMNLARHHEHVAAALDAALAAQEGERGGVDSVIVPRRLLRGLLDETDYEKSNALHGEAQALLADPDGALAKHDAEVLRAAADDMPDGRPLAKRFLRERADRIAGDQP